MSDFATHGQRADVAFVIPTLEGGGAERAFKDLANNFVADMLTVDVVMAWARGPFLKQLDPRVRVVDLACPSRLLVTPRLADYLKRQTPKAVLSGLEVMNLSVLAAQILAGTNIPTVVSVHVVLSKYINSSLSSSLRDRLFMSHMVRLLYPRAAGVIAVSQGVKDDLHNWMAEPDERVRVIHNPVDLAGIASAVTEELPKGQQLGQKAILSVGRLIDLKDHVTLIRAFAKLATIDPEVQLVILGDGPMRQELESLVEQLGLLDRVLMPGFMDNPFAWLSRARLFAMSSQFEGFGNVIIEALATGCPVVSTDCPSGPRVILQGGRFGRLTPVGDANALAEAMESSLQETPDRELLKSRAADFDLAAIAREYREALNSFAGVPLPGACGRQEPHVTQSWPRKFEQ